MIVVGAGPVGLVTAARLAAAGVPVEVLEAADQLGDELRASTFYPPTLDLLDPLGVTGELLERGLICPSWQVRLHPTGERVTFDLSVLAGETGHPYRLQVPQRELCRLLLDRLDQAGVPVRFGHRVTGLRQDPDGVDVEIGGLVEPGEWRRCAVLVGADGARSAVREAAGIGFPGMTYPETTILATTTFPFQQWLTGLSHVNYVWAPEGTLSLLRLPDLWQCSLYPVNGEPVGEAATPEAVQRKLSAIVPDAGGHPVGEIRPYRVHQRLADTFRAGRVVLAGDAAHLNSPSGGMGMNGGIHDAVALTDALVRIAGGGDWELLDRYVRRRRTVVRDEIIQQADRNRDRMWLRDPALRHRELAALRRITADPVAHKRHLLRTSMIEGLRRAETIT
ncbi:MAG: NAD(P)-binding protein [Micromonosporaceae bacterium]|nr:NAD(P)-binding protein [Micromonosporaceae bacterium]